MHTIDTGDAKSVRSLPYRLCPAWRQQVKDEIEALLKDGIIELACGHPRSFPSKRRMVQYASVWILGS